MVREKLVALEGILKTFGRVVVAYSGGVDSTFLLFVAWRVLGGNAQGILIDTPLLPPFKKEEALRVALTLGLPVEVLSVDVLKNKDVVANGPERCYFCKKHLFGEILALVPNAIVCDGTNMDETKEFRPGLRAKEELGVRSPLCEVGLTKGEIRELSRELGLPTWNKPSYTCLATRIPQGVELTRELLERIGKLEHFLEALGFSGFRVRHHGVIARLELEEKDFPLVLSPEKRRTILATFQEAGYRFVTVDLRGYQKGSMDGRT
ncbi:MAG: ATP-dependent sacrificial sulfur transferase LarE [Candidatus Caldatribacterium sp.]|uniref:ATP-dependent sacrificial sulfur transferase LarE n=1 Tax=Candidatus Caldatribacterium sp. TaxID=2282143 RepID=UPI00299A1AD8|nr:ATP-dependent sacrificial sulfur transferase LarE [Candidatus Caldatribacterium sp.]MCX7729777.1 ATP-dependent sacrificial sulfur transferase LarE [Candidatus Caldatribacterium sp.]MDW8081899.1 ATP-dependent sacrificial sulfur transferase LarE [Candidatus Calescibacterium sp.]